MIQHYTSPRHEHSRKPDCVREMLVRLLGNLPRIELFARKSSHGFDVWGNKCDSPTVSLSPARVTDVYS
ncbi:TPA: MT-A70 family methyltransferase [Escherichia coli]